MRTIRNEPVRARRTQAQRRAETRRKLMEAATRMVCERGYANASMVEIARRAGVSRGASQHHFGTRYDLFEALGEELTESMHAMARKIAVTGGSLEERVHAAIDYYWALYSSLSFHAVLNIYLGLSHDRERPNKLQHDIANVYRGSDQPWIDLLGDSKESRRLLRSLRGMVLATLRGLAVARFLGVITGSVEAELTLLREMTLDRLSRDPAESSRARTRRR